MNTNYYLDELRKQLMNKLEISQVDAADCRWISEDIFALTRKNISETTIKRFFGHANTQFNFSEFTLNTLSQFIGYTGWKQFCESQIPSYKNTAQNSWENLQKKSSIVTDFSLRAVKNKTGIPYEFIFQRNFAQLDFHYFLSSSSQLSCLVAQAGHGKSVTISQLITLEQERIANENSENIILYVNMQILNSIIGLGFDFFEWINDEAGIGANAGYKKYFDLNPQETKGTLILIIDGFENTQMRDGYKSFFYNFLYSLEKSPWIKVLLSLRPETWIGIRQKILDSPFLSSTLYKDNFYNSEFQSNLPLLTEKEIIYCLEKIDNTQYNETSINKDLLKQLKVPIWMQYYGAFRKKNDQLSIESPLISYELAYSYIKKSIFEDHNSTEAVLLLQFLATKMFLDKDTYMVHKKDILGVLTAYPEVYQSQLKKGILREERIIIDGVPQVVVIMLYEFYPYFLFKHIYEGSSQKINEGLFTYILETYTHNIPLRLKLIKWAIRQAIINNKANHLTGLITLPFTMNEKNKAFHFTYNVLLFELNNRHTELNPHSINTFFLNFLIRGEVINKLFIQTVDELLKIVQNSEAGLILTVLKGSLLVLQQKKNELGELLNHLKKFKHQLEELFPINPLILFKYHFLKLSDLPTDPDIINQILNQLNQKKTKANHFHSLSVYELLSYRLTFDLLYVDDNYTNNALMMEKIQHAYPHIWVKRTSVFAFTSKIFAGEICIKLGDIKNAQRIYDHLELLMENSQQIYYNHYVLVRLHLFKYKYFNSQKLYDEALRELDIVINYAHKDDMTLYLISAIFLKIDLLKVNSDEEILESTLDMLNKFLAERNLKVDHFRYLNSRILSGISYI